MVRSVAKVEKRSKGKNGIYVPVAYNIFCGVFFHPGNDIFPIPVNGTPPNSKPSGL